MVLIFINSILLFVSLFFSFYLFGLSLLALFYRRIKIEENLYLKKFALVVPAHNEELSIFKTLNSLLSVDYPKSNYDIIVVADNCTDSTSSIATAAGVKVMERTNTNQRGKGYALRWCFDIILAHDSLYDAVTIIDADTCVSQNYLKVLNQYLINGSDAIQTSDMVEPNPNSWSSEITRLGFTLYNHVRPLGRKVINCSAGIRGNGMCFSKSILTRIPWSTYSLNEDLEYGLILLLSGINVAFAPETAVYATMPSQVRNAVSQRSRWEKGRMPVIKIYTKKLLVSATKKLSFKLFDAFIELVTPAFVNLFAIITMLFAINVLVWVLLKDLQSNYVILWGVSLLLSILHVVVGLIAVRADKVLLKSIFYIPKYAVWKLMVYMKIFNNKSDGEWVRTTREKINSKE
jgi:1,2-diacylglycerol 3-beta-glucosyltransferase